MYAIEISDQDVEISIPNDPDPNYFSTVTLTKIDRMTGEPIPNVEFDLYSYFDEGGGSGSFIYPNQDEELKLQGNTPWYASILNGFYQEANAQDTPMEGAQYIGRYKTNELGQIIIDLPQNRWYFFKEVKPAPGYELNSEPEYFYLSDFSIDLIVNNIKEPKNLTIKKYDSITKQLLSGAIFEIYGPRKEEEIYTKNLYSQDSDRDIPTKKDRIPFLTKFIDSVYSEVTAQEVLSDIPEGFELYQEVWIFETGVTNVDLSPGTYYIKEVSPPFGYQMNDQIYKVEISDKDVEISIPNDPDPEVTQRVTINKVDSISKKPIPNTVFELYIWHKEAGGSGSFNYPDDNEKIKLQGNNSWYASILNNFYQHVSAEELPTDGISYVGQYTTDELGQIILNLPKNWDYILREVKSSPGYLPNESLQYFFVGEDPVTVDIENTPDPTITTEAPTTTTEEQTTTSESSTTEEVITTTEVSTTTVEVTTTIEAPTTTTEEVTTTTKTTTTTLEESTITTEEVTTMTDSTTTTTEATITTTEASTIMTEDPTNTTSLGTTTEEETSIPGVVITTIDQSGTSTTSSVASESSQVNNDSTTTERAGIVVMPKETSTESDKNELPESGEKSTPWAMMVGLVLAALGLVFFMKDRKA